MSLFSMTSESKIDITHRKLLKNILGVSRSCPTLAVYGETGEIPISLKSYRLTLVKKTLKILNYAPTGSLQLKNS